MVTSPETRELAWCDKKTFANNATNFTVTNAFEIRLRTSQGVKIAKLYRADVWINLQNLRKAEIFFRFATRRYVPISLSEFESKSWWIINLQLTLLSL